MNVAVRVLTPGNAVVRGDIFLWQLPELKVLVLVFLLLLSALGVIYVKDLNRRIFIEYQQLQSQGEQMQTYNNKLLLEQSAWASQFRVQQIAEQQLDMKLPVPSEIVMLKA